MAKDSTVVPMLILGVLFFIFGFVTWLNGSLIPFLKVLCKLNDFEALFVSFAFYIAYTVMAYPMSFLLERTGYKNGMALGLLIMALGSLLFIPAALCANYIVFLIALFSIGTGLTILQTASNPYVVHVGPIESAAMRISIMGLVNKGAGVIVPLAFTALIFSDLGSAENLLEHDTQTLASKLILPYLIMAVVLAGLIALVKLSSLPELALEEQSGAKTSVFHYPRVVLGAVALFFYVGIEVIAGDTIGLYAQNLGISGATSLTSFTMVFMVLGYLMGVGLIPKYLSQENALFGSSVLGIVFLLCVAFSSTQDMSISQFLWGWSGVKTLPDTIVFVALLGFSNALVWPSIWPLALKGIGRLSPKASALLITAIAGGALLPLVFGKIAQFSGDMQSAYLFGIVCYAVIGIYALKWHKMESWR